MACLCMITYRRVETTIVKLVLDTTAVMFFLRNTLFFFLIYIFFFLSLAKNFLHAVRPVPLTELQHIWKPWICGTRTAGLSRCTDLQVKYICIKIADYLQSIWKVSAQQVICSPLEIYDRNIAGVQHLHKWN